MAWTFGVCLCQCKIIPFGGKGIAVCRLGKPEEKIKCRLF